VLAATDIGRQIAAARQQRGLTQRELARLLALSERSVQGYEAGAVVPYKHLPELGRVLGRPPEWFLLPSNGNGSHP